MPCRRLPRRHSCRSPAQPKQSTPPRLHAARGCVVASGKSKNPKPAGHGPAKSSQEPPQSTANTASKPLCCLRAICWRRLLREETAASVLKESSNHRYLMRQQIFRNPLATFMKRSNLYRLKPRHASPNCIRRYADVPLCVPLSSSSFFCVFLSLPVLMRFICFKKRRRVFYTAL